jgi:hypothetical protein
MTKRVSPQEVLALTRDEDHAYLDVRSLPELEQEER